MENKHAYSSRWHLRYGIGIACFLHDFTEYQVKLHRVAQHWIHDDIIILPDTVAKYPTQHGLFATLHPTDELTTETTSTKVAAELDALQRIQGSDSASGLDSNGDLCCDLCCCTESYRKLMDFLHSKSFQMMKHDTILSAEISPRKVLFQIQLDLEMF